MFTDLLDDGYVVLEMQMDGPNQIRRLRGIVPLTIAVVTEINGTNISRCGVTDGILQAKLEILEGLDAN